MDLLSSQASATLYLQRNGETSGPYRMQDLVALLAAGQLDPLTLAAASRAAEEWRPVSVLLSAGSHKDIGNSPSVPALPSRRRSPALVWSLAFAILALGVGAIWFASAGRLLGEAPAPAAAAAAASEERLQALAAERDRALRELEHERQDLAASRQQQEKLRGELDRASESPGNAELGQLQAAVDLEIYKTLARDLLEEKRRVEGMLRSQLPPARKIVIDTHFPEELPGEMKLRLKTELDVFLGRAGYLIAAEPPAPPETCLTLVCRIHVFPPDGKGKIPFAVNTSCVGPGWSQGTARDDAYSIQSASGIALKQADLETEIAKVLNRQNWVLLERLTVLSREANFALASGIYDSEQEVGEAFRKLRRSRDPNPAARPALPLGAEPDFHRKIGWALPAAGTGMVVSPQGLVVTSSGLVRDERLLRLWLPDSGKEASAMVLASDKANGLALLRILDKELIPRANVYPRFAEAPPAIGTKLGTIGFSGSSASAREIFAPNSKVSGLGTAEEAHLFFHDAILQPGHAGALVINYDDGVVVGVADTEAFPFLLTAPRTRPAETPARATRSDVLLDFAERAGLKQELTLRDREDYPAPPPFNKLLVMVIPPGRSLPSRGDGPPGEHDFLLDLIKPKAEGK